MVLFSLRTLSQDNLMDSPELKRCWFPLIQIFIHIFYLRPEPYLCAPVSFCLKWQGCVPPTTTRTLNSRFTPLNPPSCPEYALALVKGTTTYPATQARYLKVILIFQHHRKPPSPIQKQVFSVVRLKCVSISCTSSHPHHRHVCTTPLLSWRTGTAS